MSTQAERVTAGRDFSVRDAHHIVRDLMAPRMRRYWTDLLLSAATGWGAFVLLVNAEHWWTALAAYVVAVLALYRCAVFLHEIVHFRSRSAFRTFRHGWNALVGIPLLIPAFMYETHAEHHSRRLYGTSGDCEYIAFARLSPWEIVRVAAATPLLPLFGPWRFGVLAPLSWLMPASRGYIYSRASTIKLDLEYRGRPPQPGAQRRSWLTQEALCTTLVWGTIAGVVVGAVPLNVPLAWAGVMLGVVAVNTVRLLGAHRYLGNEDEMSAVEQMLDTINYPQRRWLGELWGPVGLRLHALHHLLPGLPYHSSPAAHARLVAALPAGSAYRLTENTSLLRSIVELWQRARMRHLPDPDSHTTAAAAAAPASAHIGQ